MRKLILTLAIAATTAIAVADPSPDTTGYAKNPVGGGGSVGGGGGGFNPNQPKRTSEVPACQDGNKPLFQRIWDGLDYSCFRGSVGGGGGGF